MEFKFLDPPCKADDTPIIGLEFVSMNVASDTEKRRNKQIIRSTAMKSFHRKQQLQRSLEDGTVDRGSYSKAKTASRSGNVSPSSSWHGSFNGSSPEGLSSDGSSPDRSISRQSLAASSPASLLGAGRVDPFRIQPVDVGSRVDELLDHCKFVSCSKTTHQAIKLGCL
jgi:hypothetical protein